MFFAFISVICGQTFSSKVDEISQVILMNKIDIGVLVETSFDPGISLTDLSSQVAIG